MTLAPEWQFLERCPACDQPSRGNAGSLGIHNYVFGSRRIQLPRGGVPLAHCDSCGLVHKLAVPTPEFLKKVTALEQSLLWQPTYDFAPELAAIRAHRGEPSYDLLDVGAAGGDFLRAAGPDGGRRSALDIIRFDRLTVADGSEFIRGLIDDPGLAWSGQPYDVVTAFDIIEHLYAPAAAMANLHALTKPGGFVFIETGDTDAISPDDLHDWYYLAYFEHHIAWNAHAVSAIAHRFGFDVVSVERKRHKLVEKETFDAKALLKYHCFKLSPRIYHALQYWGGFDGSTPSKPNAKDHMQIILRRRS